MAEPYLGEVRMFAGNFAINGWQMCNGQLLSISQNTALFSILGTTYGGNGTTTFGLPDFRGRAPIHQGQGPGLPTYTVGESSGSPNTSILLSNLPAHNHTTFANAASPGLNVLGTTAASGASTPSGNYLAGSITGVSGTHGAGTAYATVNTGLAALNAGSITATPGGVTGNAGSSIPLSTQSPFLAVTFLIAMTGIFPSRN